MLRITMKIFLLIRNKLLLIVFEGKNKSIRRFLRVMKEFFEGDEIITNGY